MIRTAEPYDWPFISKISEIAGYDDYINAIGPSYMDNGQVLVYEMDGNIAGFLKMETLPDNSSWLSGLRVHPDFRRRSVATKLTEEAISKSRESGRRKVRLLVQHNNLKSLSLVAKLGFKTVSDFIFFQGIPEPVHETENVVTGEFPKMINMGWVFSEPVPEVLKKCQFFQTPGNGIVLRCGRDAWQVIRPSLSMAFAGHEFSSMEIHGQIPEYLEQHISPDFDRGSIYELPL